MLVRSVISGTLFLCGSALAGPVLEARDSPTTETVPTTDGGVSSFAFSTSSSAPVTVSEWTQAAATSTCTDPEVWTSSIAPSFTSISFSDSFPVATATEVQTTSVGEPTATVVVVTSVIATTIVVTSVIASTMVVTSVLPPPSIPTDSPSLSLPFATTDSFAIPTTDSFTTTTDSFAVPTTDSSIATSTDSSVVVSTESAGPTTSSGAVGANQNLALKTNSATLQVASNQLTAVATLLALVGAGVTLFV